MVALLIGVDARRHRRLSRRLVVDDALMRFTEFFQTIPSFVLAVVLVAIFTPSIGSTSSIAIAMVSWPPVARVVRGEFLSLRSREFVQAAEVLGRSPHRHHLREILPNALSPIIVLGLADGGDRHPAGTRAQLPGPRRSQPDELGLHDRRRPQRSSGWPGG